jgi:hypothetical protein
MLFYTGGNLHPSPQEKTILRAFKNDFQKRILGSKRADLMRRRERITQYVVP